MARRRRRTKPTTKPVDKLTPAEQKRLTGPAISTPFDVYDRLFPDYANGQVFEYKFDARELHTMLGRSGRARSLEQVLTLPLRSAQWRIDGDTEAATLVRDNLGDKLGLVIDQATTAVVYRRAFFELTWTMRDGQVVYDQIAWRPPHACQAGFDPKTGQPSGFRQPVGFPGGIVNYAASGKNTVPGHVYVPRQRAWVYTHGIHRDPLHGVSDLDVAYWCWESQQKILFLWFRFLEKQSLPNVVAYGNDPGEADRNAEAIADMNTGGVIGLERPSDPALKAFDILESSGKGADQFMQAIEWLSSEMVSSVLAGFTQLSFAATAGRGSYALSESQQQFFMASRQAVADELAEAISRDLFGPLVRYNLGANAPIPKLTIGPLADEDTARALDMLKSIVVAPQLNVPHEFVDELVLTTAAYLGLEPEKLQVALTEFAKKRAQQEAIQQAMQAQAAQAAPGQQTRTRQAAEFSATVDGAYKLVNAARAGITPTDALTHLKGAA